jgi:hypothetical protein
MCGSATLAMEVSSTSMNAASATVMAISQGLTRGFHGACAVACGLFTVTLPGAGKAVEAADKSRLLGEVLMGTAPIGQVLIGKVTE